MFGSVSDGMGYEVTKENGVDGKLTLARFHCLGIGKPQRVTVRVVQSHGKSDFSMRFAHPLDVV